MARAAAVAPSREIDARPDLTVVRRQRARGSWMTKFGILAFVALFAAVLGVVVFQTLRAQNQTKLDDLDHQVTAEQDRGKSLRLQLADAMSPDRIAQVAEQRLGMIAPNDVAYLQPKADDDAHAAWDPLKDPIPTTTLPLPPPTTAPPATIPQSTTPSTTKTPTTAKTPTTKAPGATVTSPSTTTPTTTRTSSPTSTAKPTVTTAPGKTR